VSVKRNPGADNVKNRIHNSSRILPGFDPERDNASSSATIAGEYVSRTDTLHLVAGAFNSHSEFQKALQEELIIHKELGFFMPEDRQHLYRDKATLWEKTVQDYKAAAETAKLNEEQANRLCAEELLGALAQEKAN
jgi:hypothetical protein